MTQTYANEPGDDSNYLKTVREHYETYPYPPRDPEREKTQFNFSYLCALDAMNHYHFCGKRDFSKGFKALVAGGGTGDSTIMLAEQFRGMEAVIIHLDISDASIQVAKNRAKTRNLNNITWIQGSLLDAARLAEGKFDYINCCGVLHHLESPEAGLSALATVLKDDGVIGLMLYAKYGRQGVYQVQSLMKILNRGEDNMQTRVDHCKAMLKNLPASSGFKHVEQLFRGDLAHGDAGIYDLFLHSNDVAYSVPEIYALLATSKLTLNHFFFADHHGKGNDLYRPESYLTDDSLSAVLKNLSPEEKQAAAELMHGKMVKHTFYASKAPSSMPRVDDLTQVPFMCMWVDAKGYHDIQNAVRNCRVGQQVQIEIYQRRVHFIKSANTDLLLKYLDGNKTTGDIFREITSHYPPTEKHPSIEELTTEFAVIYDAFNLQDCMFLRDKSVPAIKSVQEMQTAMLQAKADLQKT